MVDAYRDPDELLTAKAVAKILNVTPWTVYQWTRAGLLPHVRIGSRSLRFRRGGVLKSLADLEIPATAHHRHAA